MVRQVYVRKLDGSVETLTDVDTVELWFGPHYVVQVGPGHCTLIATHHGVRLATDQVGHGLEEGIGAIRSAMAATAVDSWDSLKQYWHYRSVRGCAEL